MFARVVTLQVAPEKLAARREALKQLASQTLQEIEGVHEFISLVRDDGKVVNISIFDSQSDAYGAVPQIMHARDQFADMLASRPSPEEFEVLVHERVK